MLAALVAGVVLIFLGSGSSIPGLVTYTFATFVAATIVLEFARGTRARKALADTSWPGAFSSLIGRNRRRYGGYVVHAAIVLLAIGVAGSSAFQTVAPDTRLRPGQTMRIGDYTLRYRQLTQHQGANALEERAQLVVLRSGHRLGDLAAGKNAYAVEQQVSNEVGIRTDWLRLEDLFVIADQIDPNGTVYFRVFVKPLVNLIWIAGFVFVLGSVVTLWPDAREQRRLVARSYQVGIPATSS